MSLPDGAEYWQSVKRGNSKKVFIHIAGFDCGHYHVHETNKLNHIDCFSCLKHIESDEQLTAKRDSQIKSDKTNRVNKVKLSWKRKYPNNPDCPKCGFVMLERTNKSTGSKFFGCCQYPKCKSTIANNQQS